jgi:hypothetical protein
VRTLSSPRMRWATWRELPSEAVEALSEINDEE